MPHRRDALDVAVRESERLVREPRQFRDCMIPHRAEEMSNKQHVQKKNLKVSKGILRKEVDKLRDNWINARAGRPWRRPGSRVRSVALRQGPPRAVRAQVRDGAQRRGALRAAF